MNYQSLRTQLMPEDSGTDTEQQQQHSATLSDSCHTTQRTLIERCSDAYWYVDSSYTLSDNKRMAAALLVVANEIEQWAMQSEQNGTGLVAITLAGVAQRLRDRASD